MTKRTTACETCGRDTAGRDACPRHPGARLLDLRDPEDVAWRDSVLAMRRDRRRRALAWGGSVALAVVALALLLNGAQVTNRADTFARDATIEVVLVGLAVLGVAGSLVGGVLVDLWRSMTGSDVAPELREERRRQVRRRLGNGLASAAAWFGAWSLYELALTTGLADGALGGWLLGGALLAPLGVWLLLTARGAPSRGSGADREEPQPPAATRLAASEEATADPTSTTPAPSAPAAAARRVTPRTQR